MYTVYDKPHKLCMDAESGCSGPGQGSTHKVVGHVCFPIKLLKSVSRTIFCRNIDVESPAIALMNILPLSMLMTHSRTSCCSGILQITISGILWVAFHRV